METNTESPTGEETPAPAAAPLSFAQRLSAAYEALGGTGDAAELTGLRAQVESLTTAATASAATIARLETELAAANARIQDADGAVAAFEARVQSASIARVAAAGIPPEELPQITPNTASGPRTREQLETAMAAEPDFGKRAAMLETYRKANISNN